MKAVVYTQYGPPDVLQLQELEKPNPQGNQVLVKVQASSVNAGDYRVRTGKPLVMRLAFGGLQRPKDARVGSDVAGVVEAVGEEATQFKPGDEVFGCASGAMAEYVLAREQYLALKPASVPSEQAAATPVAGLTALQAIRYAGGIQPGQKVLVQGASGGVGTFMVQLAKFYGAEVTGVCSPKNAELVRSLGAEYVIDYTRDDFTRGAQRYDLIFAINGYHALWAYRRVLTVQGVYVCVGGTLTQIFQAMLLGSLFSQKDGRKLGNMGIAKVDQADLITLGELLESGKIVPLIDRSFALDEVVEAFRYVEGTHAQGKAVIRVG